MGCQELLDQGAAGMNEILPVAASCCPLCRAVIESNEAEGYKECARNKSFTDRFFSDRACKSEDVVVRPRRLFAAAVLHFGS